MEQEFKSQIVLKLGFATMNIFIVNFLLNPLHLS